MSRLVMVVAAALVNTNNEVLLAQRPEGKSMAGMWEFPGGKIEIGEIPEAALARELQEELGLSVNIADMKPFSFASHAYPNFHLFMPLYTVSNWQGEPTAREGQVLAWANARDLQKYIMPAADVPLAAELARFLAANEGKRELP